MRYNDFHDWDLTPAKAVSVQKTVAKKIKRRELAVESIRSVAGVDVSVKCGISRASIVILSFPSLEVITSAAHAMRTVFPYIPGLLSFREGPPILECVKKLKKAPDVFIFDGQGMAHPRKAGLACHMGVILGRPSIGSAKTPLYGEFEDPPPEKGAFSEIKDKDNISIGAVLRTRTGKRPVYVSPGHLTDICSCVDIVMACSPKYRIPEPIRAAHAAAAIRGTQRPCC